MRTFQRLGAVTLAAMAMTTVACASSGSDAGADGAQGAAGPSALTFEASVQPLSSFKYDTGLIPEGSPAQVQLTLSAGGGLAVEAAAEPSGGALAGKPGGGKLSIDLHMKLAGRLKVDSTFKSYDGELPGLKDIDIPIAGSVPFDGLLLEAADSAEASADLPETTLPEIPLGSIPGSLVLTVVKGSKLTSKFHATCLSVAGGTATYSGESKTSGTLVLKGKIVLKLPTPLDKSVDLPEITVPIPEITTATNAAPLTVSGIDDADEGTCGAAAPAKGAPATSGSGSASTNGGSASGSGSDPGSDPNGGSGSGSGSGTGTGSGGGGGSGGTPPPPVCPDPSDAPNSESAVGSSFNTNDGIDAPTTIMGVISSSSDVDWYRGHVADTSFSLLQPNIQNKTSGTELCVFPKCAGTTTVTCNAGYAAKSENGESGCCASGVGNIVPTWNCSGTTDDSANLSFRVKSTGNACLQYAFSYVF